ncbi:MAG: chemotaxis response regulator protein-glutamate methylesterase [Deltaproteobacteria bacterium]|nr:chemotaxis response regulator protein-glutamate methylesterase [Deltaproteobacteria bacterium]
MGVAKLRVLVVDDSAYNRQTISEFFSGHPEFEVVGRAEDGEQGLKLTALLKPDLITLDIEMPRMDGFTFLRVLMSQMPTPVIVISSHSRKQDVFQALELGALDFVAKPQRFLAPDLSELKNEIIRKAMAVRSLQALSFARRSSLASNSSIKSIDKSYDQLREFEGQPLARIIAIGASTGGPPALQSILRVLSPTIPVAILVSQHMPEKFTKAFADRLNRTSLLRIREAEAGDVIVPGNVYISPGGAHMEITRGGPEPFIIRLGSPTPADRYVPSIDRLFTSLAKVSGPKVVGVVLTGMGADGAEGIRILHASGARTIAESEDSAIVFGMPKEAIHTGAIDEVLSLEAIVERLHGLVTTS